MGRRKRGVHGAGVLGVVMLVEIDEMGLAKAVVKGMP